MTGPSRGRPLSRHQVDLLAAEYRQSLAAEGDTIGPAARDVRSTLEALAENHGGTLSARELVTALACIYCGDRLRRRYRE